MFTAKNTQYSYLFFLTISFLLMAGAWKLGFIPLKESPTMPPVREASALLEPAPETSEPAVGSDEQPESSKPTAASDGKSEISESVPVSEESSTVPEPSPFVESDRSYFNDALFIGDSRTVGLYEYGDLGDAIVLADSGMNVYKVFGRTFQLLSGETMTLEELLSQKQFGKIYFMLGINELGYDFEQTVELYEEVIERIEEFQPDAVIFLQANLHITKTKSEESPIFNNENINRFNDEVQRMADGRSRYFLDVNELFDDEEGNLSTDYTVDEAHVLGKYYTDWVDWLLRHAVTAKL